MNLPAPPIDQIPLVVQTALGQIDFTRRYTLELLAATPRDRWYEIPDGYPTHVAWQVGHLAVSMYGLLMFRIRGRRPDDLTLIPGRLRKPFGRGGTPPTDPAKSPTADELFDKLATVYELAIAEIRGTDPAVFLEPVEMPYAVHECKLGALLFCPIHEQLHGGQIGLLRRGLGLDPIR